MRIVSILLFLFSITSFAGSIDRFIEFFSSLSVVEKKGGLVLPKRYQGYPQTQIFPHLYNTVAATDFTKSALAKFDLNAFKHQSTSIVELQEMRAFEKSNFISFKTVKPSEFSVREVPGQEPNALVKLVQPQFKGRFTSISVKKSYLQKNGIISTPLYEIFHGIAFPKGSYTKLWEFMGSKHWYHKDGIDGFIHDALKNEFNSAKLRLKDSYLPFTTTVIPLKDGGMAVVLHITNLDAKRTTFGELRAFFETLEQAAQSSID